MTSTQRFLRQRVVGTTTYSVPANVNDNLYVLMADNYVGNYGGSMVNLNGIYSITTPMAQPVGCVLRDMGKTVKAVTRDSDLPSALFGQVPGYFRAVQIIQPLNNGTFGVGGGSVPSYLFGTGAPFTLPTGNAGDKGYGTFYIPIVVDGVIASQPGGTTPLPLSGVAMLAGDVL